jgi:hypothetical protein
MPWILRGFAYLWGGVVGLSILVGYGGILFTEGWWKLAEVMSPFNVWNYGLMFVLLLPAIGAWTWADRIERRRTHRL